MSKIVTNSTTRERALVLLGSGSVSIEQVAGVCGVTSGAISQLISDPDFAAEVAALRYKALSKHNARDDIYDEMEDTLAARLKDLIPMMYKPGEVLKAIQVINGAKRRGQSAPEQIVQQQTVVNVVLPQAILSRFVVNGLNQVVQAGEQSLITVQSGSLADLAKLNREVQNDESNQRALISA